MADPRRLLLTTTAVLLAVLLAPIDSAHSRKKFAKKEDKKCSHCHMNPNGGGPRNLAGMYYQATEQLPASMDAAHLPEIKATVDKWLDEVAATPAPLIWRYHPVSEMADAEPSKYTRASDHEVLRRLALDLRGRAPDKKDVDRLARGQVTLEDLTEEYLTSVDFRDTFRLYHADLVRPRTGIFVQKPSLSRVNEIQLFGEKVYKSTRILDEEKNGGCEKDALVRVSPYWARDETVLACRDTANQAPKVTGDDGSTIDCATVKGQETGKCGCGPHLMYCYRRNEWNFVKKSMLKEGSRLAMEVVEKDLPYSEILTADWSMWNGRLEHYYARLDGRLGQLKDPDVNRPYHRVERDAKHAGILSTHSYLNFFYNGRRWAQRTFESFMCHETTPDFDLLDEFEDLPPTSYRPHPAARPDINVSSGRACAACHLQLDGLSRVKDRWDNFGQYWGEKNPVPVTIKFFEDEVTGLDAFGEKLAGSDVFLDCAVNQAWDHMVGHRFQPDEIRTRRRLLAAWKDKGLKFKDLLRMIVATDEYRASENLKIMERELYTRVLERVTGVKWKVGDKRGWDVYYDKVGGMDYRKIESRDRTPGQGHSLVQYKAAAEICSEVMDRDRRAGSHDERRMLGGVSDVTDRPDDGQLTAVIDEWFVLLEGRPANAVETADRQILKDLFKTVADQESTLDGYKAVCTAMLGAADFALY
jgi:hypothetical protein